MTRRSAIVSIRGTIGPVPIRQKHLRRAIQAAMAMLGVWERQQRRLQQVVAGAALGGLEAPGLQSLTMWAYGKHSREYQSLGLWPWEEAWLGRDLPPAPARILIGAAGTGREAAHLDGGGYATVCFDPVPLAVKVARARRDLPRCLAFVEGSFEGLVAPSADADRGFVDEIDRHAPYDAVLLGWCGINHLPGQEARRNLLATLRRLCPAGPLLLSYWQDEGRLARRRPRAWELGWKLGGWLAGGRTVDPAEVAGDMILSHVGYAHRFTADEIRDMAESAGYAVGAEALERPDGVHPHATLIPRAGASR